MTAEVSTSSSRAVLLLPLWLLPLVSVVLVGLGVLVDRSSLEQPPESWGYALPAAALALYVGAPVLLGGLVLLLVASVSDHGERRLLGWLAVLVCQVLAVGLALLGVVCVRDSSSAGLVFGSACGVLALTVATAPFVLQSPRRRRSRQAS